MSHRIQTSILCCGRKILKTMWNNFTQIQWLFISIHNAMLVQYICHIKSNLVYFWSYFIKSVPCRYTLRSPLVLVGFLSLNLLLCGLVYLLIFFLFLVWSDFHFFTEFDYPLGIFYLPGDLNDLLQKEGFERVKYLGSF